MKHREIEFKYEAVIPLSDFKSFCIQRNPLKFQIVSGFDHFYSNSSDADSFYRHRVNTNENQLTFKRKLRNDNNFIREERNIDLPTSVSEDKIREWCEITQYFYDSTIFKNCFIYNYDYYTLVYYFTYDAQLKPTGRYIEIEMKEDYKWTSEEEAFNELLILEKLCKSIGASPDNRIYKSLYEMSRTNK